ncbi:MAG: hypothetical protein VKJ06_07715 [Vampirovibrionales bacterium]|nr:hypothetical protein [Vampirovibrionales bacterium]
MASVPYSPYSQLVYAPLASPVRLQSLAMASVSPSAWSSMPASPLNALGLSAQNPGPQQGASSNASLLWQQRLLTPPQAPVTPVNPAQITPHPELQAALKLLGTIKPLPADVNYLKQMGVDVIYPSGADALRTIIQKGIKVEFAELDDDKAHAEWIAEENRIVVNKKYQGDVTPATLYGLAAALFHEAGHAGRRGDNEASIQEEINCLALNVLAHRYFQATQPAYQFAASQSRLITDGVALYSNLFFDTDPSKQRLVQRVIQKYGMLPPNSPDHPTPNTAIYGTRPLLQAIMLAKQALGQP